jgi:hypothetical protein
MLVAWGTIHYAFSLFIVPLQHAPEQKQSGHRRATCRCPILAALCL